MNDTEPQTAAGKVLLHFTMSLDGLVAGPGHDMDWMTGFSNRPGLLEEYVETTGAVLGGRDGWDATPDDARPYSDAWEGSIFVLTHHPEDATPADGVTFLDCDPAEALRVGLKAAGGKNLAVLSPTIGRQLLELGLIDEIDLHVAPVLLGDGIRPYDNPGGRAHPARAAQRRRRDSRGEPALSPDRGTLAPRPLVNSAQVRMTSALRVRGACRKRPLNRDAEPQDERLIASSRACR